jgi:hypothetical protein
MRMGLSRGVMGIAAGIVIALVAGCGGSSAESGGEATISDEAGANNQFHGTSPLVETTADHLPNNRNAPVSELIFNVGTVVDGTWIHILFHEPVAVGSFVVKDEQFTQILDAEATIEYDEYGMNRTWAATGGTLMITTADIPTVSIEIVGATMTARTYTDATGTFTLAATATATSFDPTP